MKTRDMLLIIGIGVLSRLAPHPPNVTAVGALAVFSGAHLDVKRAIVATVIIMLLTDLVLGFHSVMWATYAGMIAGIVLGRFLKHKRDAVKIAGVTLTSSVLFFILTNYAVWAVPHSMYPHTVSGLWESYVMGLPFFRNSLIGDFFYSTVFFGGYELVVLVRSRLGTAHA